MAPALIEVNRPCFVCGEEHSTIAFRPDVRRWRYEGEFILRRCAGCGLVFNSPRLPPEDLGALYRRNYYVFERPASAEFDRITAAYRRTIAHLPIAQPATLLEVGSAKGYMLALLRGLGWQVAGVEIAPAAAAFSRRAFGVEVFTGTLEAFQRADRRRVDVVLAQDVLEHVPEPAAFLAAARGALRPGGWLVVDTPNVGARNVGVVGARWRGFNPFHIWLFDSQSLARAVANAGFEVQRIGSYNDVAPEASVLAPVSPSSGRLGGARWIRTKLRQVADHLTLASHLKRAITVAREQGPIPLDPQCQGENLVCLAFRTG